METAIRGRSRVTLAEKQEEMRQRHERPSQRLQAAAGKLWRAGRYVHKQGGTMSALFVLDDLYEQVMSEMELARADERREQDRFKFKRAGV